MKRDLIKILIGIFCHAFVLCVSIISSLQIENYDNRFMFLLIALFTFVDFSFTFVELKKLIDTIE